MSPKPNSMGAARIKNSWETLH